VKLKEEIEQKESIIKIKDEQNLKYALLKQEEKKEKEEWIKKYDVVQKEKNDWVGKYYSIKMYMVVFLVLLILASVFIVWSSIK
jgi:quinol-cytochrome oxidoreductase complex cytochrome b subunit